MLFHSIMASFLNPNAWGASQIDLSYGFSKNVSSIEWAKP